MPTRSLFKIAFMTLPLLAASMTSTMAADEIKQVKILFIGNSFTAQHNIPDQVRDFAELGNPDSKVETMRVIYGGSQAERHWNAYGTANLLNLSGLKREDLDGEVARMTGEAEALKKIIDQAKAENKDPKNKAERHYGHFQNAINYQQEWAKLLEIPPKFDYVVLQSYRDEIGGLNSPYAEYARKFAKVIHNHGAKMVLYVTAQRDQNGQPLTELPDPKPFMEQATAMAQLGNELDALVVPVPLAIQKLREKRLDLTTRYSKDAHLNQVTAYLTLCCFYATLFDKSPVGLDVQEVNAWAGDRKDPDGNPMHRVFDEKTAQAIQQAAWEAVQEMQKLQKSQAAP